MKPNDRVKIVVYGQLGQGRLIQKRLWGWLVRFDYTTVSETGASLYTQARVRWVPNWRIWPVELSPSSAKQGDKT
jgi:hypothetical protein